jgi:hypothetical protein
VAQNITYSRALSRIYVSLIRSRTVHIALLNSRSRTPKISARYLFNYNTRLNNEYNHAGRKHRPCPTRKIKSGITLSRQTEQWRIHLEGRL